MAQKFVSPQTESELRITLDQLYAESKAKTDIGEKPSFRGLLEIISAEPTILTAIHNIKANKGAKTAGSDKEKMQEDILEKDYQSVISRVQNALKNYQPNDIRRVLIPKPGKTEMRPLGIPTIIDRIVQECVHIVLDPICEAQFFNHSYGFRPHRSAQQALVRVTYLTHNTGYHWVIEGDISKFFDTISHTTLLKKLYHMGIKDRRVLMIIRQMLKAGIMGEKGKTLWVLPKVELSHHSLPTAICMRLMNGALTSGKSKRPNIPTISPMQGLKRSENRATSNRDISFATQTIGS